MRAVGVLLLLVASVSVFTTLSLMVMTADTFRERLHHHRLQRERANVYAHSPRRAASRSRWGSFTSAERRRAFWRRHRPSGTLWGRVMTLPPLIKSIGRIPRDLHQVVLTVVAVVGLWAWARKFTQPNQQTAQWQTWQRGNAGFALPVFKAQPPVFYSNAMTPARHAGPEIRQMDY